MESIQIDLCIRQYKQSAIKSVSQLQICNPVVLTPSINIEVQNLKQINHISPVNRKEKPIFER